MASTATNQWSASYWQNIIEEVWTDELGKGVPLYKSFLDEKTTKKKYVEYGEVAGPQLWSQTAESQDLVLDDFGEGIKTRVEPVKFSKRLIIPEEMEEFSQYSEMYDCSRWLADTCKLTMDYDATGILNDMFTGANGHVGGDALPYASASHPIRGGSLVSNLMAPVSPSNMAVGTMLVTADRLAGSNGLINSQYKVTKLVGPSAYRFRMKEILKSGQKDDTANNAINAIKGELSSDYVAVPYMSSTSNWFGKTNVKLGSIMLFNRRPRFRQEPHFTNETKAFLGSAMWICTVINWRDWIAVNI